MKTSPAAPLGLDAVESIEELVEVASEEVDLLQGLGDLDNEVFEVVNGECILVIVLSLNGISLEAKKEEGAKTCEKNPKPN
ncbi:hypothetical protein L6452_06180 [Arctium lappa]|uniref:Uncharacterized protein n=1 Tax=Arctium lappa TaxID=4217 RepID=A0ACB9EJ54_ARCLA|nr:hypothetical protein L6452_06180 [Arctium lappa]